MINIIVSVVSSIIGIYLVYLSTLGYSLSQGITNTDKKELNSNLFLLQGVIGIIVLLFGIYKFISR